MTAQSVPLLFLEPVLSMHSLEPIDHIWACSGFDFVTDLDVAHDLRPLTPDECAARGLRQATDYDDSTAFDSHDSERLRLGALRSAGRKMLK